MSLAPREPIRQCHPLWLATDTAITTDSSSAVSREHGPTWSQLLKLPDDRAPGQWFLVVSRAGQPASANSSAGISATASANGPPGRQARRFCSDTTVLC